MARVNADIVYANSGNFFIRRDPTDHSKWQVVDGSKGEDKKFNVTEVLATGLESGKLARAKGEELKQARKAAAAG